MIVGSKISSTHTRQIPVHRTWEIIRSQPRAKINNGQLSARNPRILQMYLLHKLQIPAFHLSNLRFFGHRPLPLHLAFLCWLTMTLSLALLSPSYLSKNRLIFSTLDVFSAITFLSPKQAANIFKDIYLPSVAWLQPHMAWHKLGVNSLKSKKYWIGVKVAPLSPAGNVAINCPSFSLNPIEKKLSASLMRLEAELTW